jgi:hypothetical protein
MEPALLFALVNFLNIRTLTVTDLCHSAIIQDIRFEKTDFHVYIHNYTNPFMRLTKNCKHYYISFVMNLTKAIACNA